MEFIQVSPLGNEFTMNSVLERLHTMLIKQACPYRDSHMCTMSSIPVINESWILKGFLKPATRYHSELFLWMNPSGGPIGESTQLNDSLKFILIPLFKKIINSRTKQKFLM